MNIGQSEFSVDIARERAIAHLIQQGTPRAKRGKTLALIFAIIGVVGVIGCLFLSSGDVAGTLAAMVVVVLFPFLGAMISLAVAKSGGRDVVLSRLGEKVYLQERALLEVYEPRYKTIECYRQIAHSMAYADIRSITYNRAMCRYELVGRFETIRYPIGYQMNEQSILREWQEGTLFLYDYFYGMDMLITQLQQKSNITVTEAYYHG